MRQKSCSRRRATSTLRFAGILVACCMTLVGIVFAGVHVVHAVAVGHSATARQPVDEYAVVDNPPPSAQDSPETDARNLEPFADTSQPGIDQRIDRTWLNQTATATGIPLRALAAYAGADAVVREDLKCAVGWNTLAAIGYVETHHGTLNGGAIERDGGARPAIYGVSLDGVSTALIRDTDAGQLDGDPVYDRAVGPMQFIPETWQRWGRDGSGDGQADPHQIDDAALTAAYYLCESQGSLESADAWISAVRSYNNSVEYQSQVAQIADQYALSAKNAAVQ